MKFESVKRNHAEEDAKLRAAEIGDESQVGSEEFESKVEPGVEKKSLYETGKETISAASEKAKAKWEKVRGGMSKGANWLKEKMLGAGYMAVGAGVKTVEGVKAAGSKAKEGVENVYNKANEKYDALTGRGQQAFENMKNRVTNAKNKCFDAFYQMRLDKLSAKQANEQAKLNKIMQEKVYPLRARIDEIRRKKAEISSRMSSSASFEGAAAAAPA